jgi:hypothetical protein
MQDIKRERKELLIFIIRKTQLIHLTDRVLTEREITDWMMIVMQMSI